MSSRFTAFFDVEVDFDMLDDVEESALNRSRVIEDIRATLANSLKVMIEMGYLTKEPIVLDDIRVEADPELELH